MESQSENMNHYHREYVSTSKDQNIVVIENNHDRKNIDFKNFIILQSNDPQAVEYVVDRNACKMSGFIKDILEDQDLGNGEETIISLPNINGNTLVYIIQYMNYHKNNKPESIEKPLKGKVEDVICSWDKEFLFTVLVGDGDEKRHETLIDVIMAANFLNMKDLLDLTCATVASIVKGKTPEQIRQLFNIENDLTPEEEEKILKENRWCRYA